MRKTVKKAPSRKNEYVKEAYQTIEKQPSREKQNMMALCLMSYKLGYASGQKAKETEQSA